MKRKDSRSSVKRRATSKDAGASVARVRKVAEKAARVRRGIISPRDERGVPYPGDWPNPLGEKNRGCF
ncbi:MAG TPA: hypothetical protein VJ803_06895 [Gemmatimonadaceae bacterium]|nr:hypothetical protein [Gemmatimonadaceae bacterium]